MGLKPLFDYMYYLLISEFRVKCASWPASTMGLLTGTLENINTGELSTEATHTSDQNNHTFLSNAAAFVTPHQQQSPLADRLPPQPWSPGSSRYYEAYCQLSSILYILQVSSHDFSGIQTPTLQPYQALTLDQIFEQVSIICGIVSWLSQHIPIPSPITTQANTYTFATPAANNDIDYGRLHIVIKSLITTILALYSERLKKYQSLCTSCPLNPGNMPTKKGL